MYTRLRKTPESLKNTLGYHIFFIYLFLEIELEGSCVTKEEESELTLAEEKKINV